MTENELIRQSSGLILLGLLLIWFTVVLGVTIIMSKIDEIGKKLP